MAKEDRRIWNDEIKNNNNNNNNYIQMNWLK